MKRAARRIVQILRVHGHEAFFAGGWVRDSLLKRRPQDIDIATSALPEEVLRLFPHSTAIGAAFGVVRVRSCGHAYDVSTFRTEGPYLDGRHPSSVTFTSAQQDAMRRDFTVNGLFYDPLERLIIDYVGGRADIGERILRTIGNPGDRFEEDKLRLLRAVRLACALDFQIASRTWKAIRQLAPGITVVSSERIRDELLKIVAGPHPARGLDLLHRSGLLARVLPEVEALASAPGNLLKQTGEALRLLRRRSAVTGMAALLHALPELSPAPRDICERLRLSKAQTESVVALVAGQQRVASLGEARESTLKRALRDPALEDHLELHRVATLAAGRSLENYELARRKLRDLRRFPPGVTRLITGQDLRELGYTPGPLFREILESVEDLALENALHTRAEAIRHVLRTYPLRDSSTNGGRR